MSRYAETKYVCSDFPVCVYEVRICHGMVDEEAPTFCVRCGKPMGEGKTPAPYIGKPPDTGVYRVTFAPVEDEFHSEYGAQDAARHSAWGEDREFGDYRVEKLKSTVPPSEFPYVCGNPECDGYVSKTDQGRCSCCSAVDWKLRE